MIRDGNRYDSISKWLRLHLSDGVGAVTFAKLLEYFGDIDSVLQARMGELCSIPGIKQKTAERIIRSRDSIDVDKEIKLAEKLGVNIITMECDEYPSLLKEIHPPPAVLYVKGNLQPEDQLAIAIVGSRSCSHYGQEQASRLGHLLSAAGFTIVSGLARGIDTSAHQGALSAGGRTIAVQGRGLADIYPEENRPLGEEIADSGAIISELPLKYEPISGTFPARNRIITGLSLGTIVVEARHKSGALITAKLAMEQNREVMAVPGRVDSPGSQGPHQLIKDGAVLVEKVEDVLDALGYLGKMLETHATHEVEKAELKAKEKEVKTAVINSMSDMEFAVYNMLSSQPSHTDEIVNDCRMSICDVYATVTSLQLKGVIIQHPGGYYTKR